MTNEVGNTELDVLIPELWQPQLLEGRYAALRGARRCLNVDGEVAAVGDRLHLPIEPSLSANAVGATGTVTNQATTPSEAVLVVDKWYEATMEVIKKASKQAFKTWQDRFGAAAGRKLGEQIETDFLALQSDISQTEGDGAGDIGEDELTAAIADLLGNNIDVMMSPQEHTFMFHTSQWKALKKNRLFNEAQVTGEAVGGTLKATIPNIYGVPTFFSSAIASVSSTRRNLLYHREAFAVGLQSPITVQELPSSKLTRIFCADTLYGVKTVRATYAVVLKSKA